MRSDYGAPRFDFFTNPRVVMGLGEFARLPDLVCSMNASLQPAPESCRRVLLVRGGESLQQTPQWRNLLRELNSRGIQLYEQEVSCEPSVELIDGAVEDYREEHIQVVVGIGGGSVMDAAKAIAAMLTVSGSVEDYLEGIGTRQHPGTTLPVVAVPTTAGTGSEATKNSVISKLGRNGYKKSLRHDNFVPDLAILDGELSIACPSGITAACGLDALTQLMEAYTSTKANLLTDALAISGLHQLAWALPVCVESSSPEPAARQAMLYAAYASGVCLANAGLGVVHGMAGVIGGRFDIAHGVVCGALLDAAVRVNINTMQRDPASFEHPINRYRSVGSILCSAAGNRSGTAAAEGDDGLHRLTALLQDWKLRWNPGSLSRFGVGEQDIPGIISASGQKNNPVVLSENDMSDIVHASL
ncbi:iron-containing alcohol dehydrogenase [Spirochaeta africana]|uniref:Alcohol dehydrogenase, class IV n=1 Tax=Spirochaeta africana (strain ATCC 700263 / DSM 8902 / Z-7692) TaxID=889378 RepID=H9UIP8_SPIAZ|nr:iron-containing alcohol dehydrogenase [Spirochaeta africana]AFG37391.1 alcohol dehydrogenase, class IV [Spirochaeta africana DSM 8902]